ncbi:hypothetical protein ACFL1Z_08635 [Thermodesulfobacteriota bacterium]
MEKGPDNANMTWSLGWCLRLMGLKGTGLAHPKTMEAFKRCNANGRMSHRKRYGIW